jgi:hypothetical protein
MDFIDLPLDLPIDGAEQAREHPNVRRGSLISADAVALQSSIFADFLNSCALVAATASIANALTGRRPACDQALIARYLPPIPALFARSYLELCIATGPHPFATDLANFYSRMRMLRDLLASAAALAGETAKPLQLDLTGVARDWRALARSALELIDDGATLPGGRGEGLAARRDTVKALLADAQAGGTPCLTAVGAIELPAWADRRARKRTPKNLQAIFLIGGSFQSAVVVDASERGLGVVGLREVTVGESVILLIKPGVSIAGQIAWVSGPRAGIRLAEPLPARSQFLAHLH